MQHCSQVLSLFTLLQTAFRLASLKRFFFLVQRDSNRAKDNSSHFRKFYVPFAAFTATTSVTKNVEISLVPIIPKLQLIPRIVKVLNFISDERLKRSWRSYGISQLHSAWNSELSSHRHFVFPFACRIFSIKFRQNSFLSFRIRVVTQNQDRVTEKRAPILLATWVHEISARSYQTSQTT